MKLAEVGDHVIALCSSKWLACEVHKLHGEPRSIGQKYVFLARQARRNYICKVKKMCCSLIKECIHILPEGTLGPTSLNGMPSY